MSTERVSDERLAEMVAGLEGVTPGPWDTVAGLVRSIDDDVAIPIFEGRDPWKKHRRISTVQRQAWHNLDHIARCDPDTMRSILTELLSLRSHAIPNRLGRGPVMDTTNMRIAQQQRRAHEAGEAK